jgi:CDP-diacylglycerol pyrophosphatase
VKSTLPRRSSIGIGLLASVLAQLPATAQHSHQKPTASSEGSTYSPEINSGRDSLRQIVQQQCVVNWIQKHDPAPCERVFLPDSDPEGSGYAVLADRKGGAHYLLIPTQTMAGIESSELLDPDAPNYLAEAWHSRDLLAKSVGQPVPRTAVGLAINTANARTQDQFHVHIECLRPEVAASLRAGAAQVGDTWAPLPVAGSTYQAERLMGDGLDGANAFELLAKLGPEVRHHMGDYTLVAAGMQFKSGPGFILLTGTGPTGELLLDPTCALAGGGG